MIVDRLKMIDKTKLKSISYHLSVIIYCEVHSLIYLWTTTYFYFVRLNGIDKKCQK